MCSLISLYSLSDQTRSDQIRLVSERMRVQSLDGAEAEHEEEERFKDGSRIVCVRMGRIASSRVGLYQDSFDETRMGRDGQ